jgi:hypothetical protein
VDAIGVGAVRVDCLWDPFELSEMTTLTQRGPARVSPQRRRLPRRCGNTGLFILSAIF